MWRMRVDYRDLNNACPKDCYPLPMIDQLVDSTTGCELLSMMDVFQGYHQIKMHLEDITKTAFAVCSGVFAHPGDLEEIFSVIRQNRLMLNPTKCSFGVKTSTFLGYKVITQGIEANQSKVQAILEMTAPRNIKEVQKLNGRITALARFISQSAEKRKHSLGTVLIKEENGKQNPSRSRVKLYKDGESITGNHGHSSETKTLFISHKVIIRTALPFGHTLRRPDPLGRMVIWAIELDKYDVDFEPRTAIKAQALANFIQETTRSREVQLREAWVDGSFTKEGCGVSIHIITPTGEVLQVAVKYAQRLSNNEAEYEAMVKALKILLELGADRAHVKSDSQLVAQQFLGTYETRDDRLQAYYTGVKGIMNQFQEVIITQIPREQNNTTDLLARMASAVEGTWTDKVILLHEGGNSGDYHVLTIENRED
ncbi:uncharacterized protein LOC130994017 [Salvia miltiorrhiza]|uniref:uncharacterized protein LOC130994017 n=1 Tax=Salvia miltiorrhiza TaxID=226208 RepID=UPI0025AC31D1|nr:uncharacterized protein LOC130994017 [Salvia miltiorrhiza]